MRDVSVFRLYVLRLTYLLLFVGLVLFEVGPGVLNHPLDWTIARGTMHALLVTVGLLSLLGLRYPLRMLPLLLFELLWKVIWLVAFAWPVARAGQVDASWQASIRACAGGVVLVLLVVPWPYVFERYVKARSDRWH
jgi:hypothetical protein